VNPRAGLDSNSDPSVVHPIASRYTDCAIPALDISHKTKQNSVTRSSQFANLNINYTLYTDNFLVLITCFEQWFQIWILLFILNKDIHEFR
jgi:hypothetical protein